MSVGPVNCSSEAIFGSLARGRVDSISDRDYLIVDDCPVRRRVRKRQLEYAGWSVAAYTWRRLERLSATGALFVQHLKLESKIVVDDGGRLRALLDSFSPNSNYSDEIAESKLLVALATSNLTNYAERLWAADVLAVAVRNIGVLTLAEQGIYEFDYTRIVHHLACAYDLSTSDIYMLMSLRHWKDVYRNGPLEPGLSRQPMEQLLAALARRGKFPHHSDFSSRGLFEFSEHFQPYLVQRLIERDLLSAVPLGGKQISEFEAVTEQVWRVLRRPRDYAWQFSVSSSPIWSCINWLQENTFSSFNAVWPKPQVPSARPLLSAQSFIVSLRRDLREIPSI